MLLSALLGRFVSRPPLLVLLIVVCGCGDNNSIAVRTWTLVKTGRTHAVTLPAHVDDLLGARRGSYELRTSVPLPRALRGRALTLAIPRLPARVELRVGGATVESSESSLLVGYRSPGAHRWRIQGALTDVKRLELALTVDDTWFQSAWIDSTPRLSAHREGDRWFRFVSAFNLMANAVATVLVMTIGLAYLVVFLGNRAHRDYGWMAAQALTASSYPLFMLGATQWMLGAHDQHFLALVAVAALVSVGYAHAHFGLPAASRWWLAGSVVTVLVAALAGGPYTNRFGMMYHVATIGVAFIYQLVLCTRLLRHGTRQGDALMQLIAWLVLSATAGLDLTYWVGLGSWHNGFQGAAVGLSVFALLQTTALSREHLRVVTEAQAFNEELRRQVSARSRQLSHALARLGRSMTGHQDLTVGTIVDGRYRVLRLLGEGAMAAVYEVKREEDGQRFALKQLRRTSDARMLARFAREAHIAAEVSHPNLVGIHDIDFASGGFMYIVMDLVRGRSLGESRDRYGDVPWALEVLRQTAHGIAAMHAKGVIHRDLKPANILLAEGDAVVARISDFGVSGLLDETGPDRVWEDAGSAVTKDVKGAEARLRVADVTSATADVDPAVWAKGRSLDSPMLTQAGQFLGTPAYMPPELADRAVTGPSHDVFSFGTIAFEVLTGERPYDVPPLRCRVSKEPPPAARRLAELCQTLDPTLAATLQAAVAIDPALRPDVAALVEALDNSRPGGT